MGLARKALILIAILAIFYLGARFSIVGLLVGLVIFLGILHLTRPGRGLARPRLPISLRRFISLLGLVALLAILYSPTTLRVSVRVGGGEDPTAIDSSSRGMSKFVAFLRYSGHQVMIVNDSVRLRQEISSVPRAAYFLIGPDHNMGLQGFDAALIRRRYSEGSLSLLIAEGNSTNNSFLVQTLGVEVSGAAVVDPDSSFQNKKVFNVTIELGAGPVKGVLDVASPIRPLLAQSLPGNFRVVGSTGPKSYDWSLDPLIRANTTLGPRAVVIAGEQIANRSRSILISDSAPFRNYLFNYTNSDINETAFVNLLVQWATGSDRNVPIILDNFHYYRLPSISSVGIGLPVGALFALFLRWIISTTDSYYNGFLSAMKPYEIGLALLTVLSVYWGLTSRYAFERRGKDDEASPVIEKRIVAQSRARQHFLETYRTKGFYRATLWQLYEVLDEIARREFTMPIGSLKPEHLTSRMSVEDATRAVESFSKLSRIYEYAKGQRRFLFPPVVRWKATVARHTTQAEKFLNQLGLTISGVKAKRQLEYRLRGR